MISINELYASHSFTCQFKGEVLKMSHQETLSFKGKVDNVSEQDSIVSVKVLSSDNKPASALCSKYIGETIKINFDKKDKTIQKYKVGSPCQLTLRISGGVGPNGVVESKTWLIE